MENLEPRSLTDLTPDLLALIYKKLTFRSDRKSLFQCTKAMRVPQVGCFTLRLCVHEISSSNIPVGLNELMHSPK